MNDTVLFKYSKAGGIYYLLPWQLKSADVKKLNITPEQVEELALAHGLLPAQLNQKMLTKTRQLCLVQKSTMAVADCAGLVSCIMELASKLGIVHLIVISPHMFGKSNSNSQLLSTISNFCQSKVDAPLSRAKAISPAVFVTACKYRLSRLNQKTLLAKVQAIIDTLYSIGMWLGLAETTILPVRDSVFSRYGQLTSQQPSQISPQKIYCSSQADRCTEKEPDKPLFTPEAKKAMQAAKVCKIALGKGPILYGRLLCVNLLKMGAEETSYE